MADENEIQNDEEKVVKTPKSVEEMGFLRPVITDLDWLKENHPEIDQKLPHKEMARKFLIETIGFTPTRSSSRTGLVKAMKEAYSDEEIAMIMQNPELVSKTLGKIKGK